MKSTAINRFRCGWTADYVIVDNRVTGDLFQDGSLVRHFKNVKISDGRFKVDIGTGSGVKVTFEVA
jgi:hypothetical protein